MFILSQLKPIKIKINVDEATEVGATVAQSL
jgi:hypothetical protein